MFACNQSAIAKAVEDLLTGTSFDGVGEPVNLTFCVLVGVGQYGKLCDGELVVMALSFAIG